MSDFGLAPGDGQFGEKLITPDWRAKEVVWPDGGVGRESPRMRSQRFKKEQAQQYFLSLIAEGVSTKQALEEVGRVENTLGLWLRDTDGFREAYDKAKARQTVRFDSAANQTVYDFITFRKKYFGFDTWQVHEDIIRRLERQTDASTDTVGVQMILCPPATGKSTLVADWICWKIAQNPNIRILIVSAGRNLAEKMTQRIRGRLNPGVGAPEHALQLVRDYGPFYVPGQEKNGKPWSAPEFRVAGYTGDTTNYTVEAKGMGSKIYGNRFDIIICDDLQEIETAHQTDKIMDWFQGTLMSRTDDGADDNIVWLGTRCGIDDCASRLAEQRVVEPENIVEYPIIDAQGRPTIPEKWTIERLAKLRKQRGEKIWWTYYMMQPAQATDATFNAKYVEENKRADYRRYEKPANETGYVSVDPALGGGCAVLTSFATPEHFTVVDCTYRFNLSRNEDIYAIVAQHAAVYDPRFCVFEIAALQRGMARSDSFQAVARQFGFNIVEHETAGKKTDPHVGVAEMAGALIRGELRFADGDPATREALKPLYDQLLAWRPKEGGGKILVQDCVMALWFAWHRWKTTMWRRPGTEYTPIQTGYGTPKPSTPSLWTPQNRKAG